MTKDLERWCPPHERKLANGPRHTGFVLGGVKTLAKKGALFHQRREELCLDLLQISDVQESTLIRVVVQYHDFFTCPPCKTIAVSKTQKNEHIESAQPVNPELLLKANSQPPGSPKRRKSKADCQTCTSPSRASKTNVISSSRRPSRYQETSRLFVPPCRYLGCPSLEHKHDANTQPLVQNDESNQWISCCTSPRSYF